MADSFATLFSAVAALAGIVGLILVLGRALRMTMTGRTLRMTMTGRALRMTTVGRVGPSGRSLVVTETIALDARRRLHLVRHGERSVLLLTGGGNDVVVGWLDGPPA